VPLVAISQRLVIGDGADDAKTLGQSDFGFFAEFDVRYVNVR
jgi:hypothetical protein